MTMHSLSKNKVLFLICLACLSRMPCFADETAEFEKPGYSEETPFLLTGRNIPYLWNAIKKEGFSEEHFESFWDRSLLPHDFPQKDHFEQLHKSLRTEFDRARYYQQIKPAFEEYLNYVKNVKYVYWTVNRTLGGYDFEQGGFWTPVNKHNLTGIQVGGGTIITPENPEKMSLLKIPPERAEEIVRKLSSYDYEPIEDVRGPTNKRGVKYIFTGEIAGIETEENFLTFSFYLLIKVTSMEVKYLDTEKVKGERIALEEYE